MLLETHAMILSKTIFNPWNTGCAEVQSQSFRPVEGSRLNLRNMNLKRIFKYFNIFKVASILCPKVACHPRWVSDTDSATQTPVTECPYFWSWDFKIA